jgi:hypothetical protein
MNVVRVVAAFAALAGVASVAVGQLQMPPPKLSAEQIVAKNAAARGGLNAWRNVQTMYWSGHIESAHAPAPSVLFVMQQQRPNKTRFEVNAMSERTVRVFDGEQGWKVRPTNNGRPAVQPYTAEELQFARGTQGIDGPLIDYATKGTVVTVEGLDEIEGHKAYRLGVQLPSGERDRIWIDANTFLDLRYDREAGKNAAGLPLRVVSVFYRDYKSVEGLKIPSVIETGVGPGSTPDKMVIERVVVNPTLDPRTFDNPGAPRPRTPRPFDPRALPRKGTGVVPAPPAQEADPK